MGDFSHGKMKIRKANGSVSNSANHQEAPAAASGTSSKLHIDLPSYPEIFNSLGDLPNTGSIGALTSFNYSLPSPAGGNTPNSTPDRNSKKREIDRMYRERQKRGKEEMSSKLVALSGENSRLEEENKALKSQHKDMNEILQAQSEEIEKLKADNERLKSDYEKQHGLVQTLSGLLANAPDLQLENRKLQIENELLRQLQTATDKMSYLMQENGNLQIENKILKVQNNALCGKLIFLHP